MFTAIGSLALMLILVLFPLLIPALVTIGHAVGSVRGRRHHRRTAPATNRVSDAPRGQLPVAGPELVPE